MRDRRRMRKALRLLPLLLVPALAAGLWYASVGVAYAANLRVYAIPSGSMAPTLAVGDRISVDVRGGTPERGEVWLFAMPTGGDAVKRVIGLPGESIEVAGGRVRVDGKPLDEPYLLAPMAYAMPAVRLKPDEYFLMGDSRNASQDSHVWGPLPKARLIGRAEHRYRPGRGIGGLR